MDKEQLKKDLEPGINFIESMARAESDKEGRWHRALAALGVLFGETLESEEWPNIDPETGEPGDGAEGVFGEDEEEDMVRGGSGTPDPDEQGDRRRNAPAGKPATAEEG